MLCRLNGALSAISLAQDEGVTIVARNRVPEKGGLLAEMAPPTRESYRDLRRCSDRGSERSLAS
jgi:hypothetical protein